MPEPRTDDRWDRLFGDVDAELRAAQAAERSAEVAERSAFERGRVALRDRLVASIGREVRWGLPGAGERTVRLLDLGPDWALGEQPRGTGLLVSLGAVDWVVGLARVGAVPGSSAGVDLDLRMMLRRVSADRVPVAFLLRSGVIRAGRVGWVGADFAELFPGGPASGAARPPDGAVLTVPLSGIDAVELPAHWLTMRYAQATGG